MGKSTRDRARAAESTLNGALRHTHHRPEARYAVLGPTASTSTSSGHPDTCLHEHRPHPRRSGCQSSGDLKSWASNLKHSTQQFDEFNLDTGLKLSLCAQDTPFSP